MSAAAFFLNHGPEAWHPNPAFFYQPGGGPLFDLGPYYLTALVALLGPVVRVAGAARASFPERTVGSEPNRGSQIPVRTPTHIAGLLEFASGALGTLLTSFDVWKSSLPSIEIYGSEGTPPPTPTPSAARCLMACPDGILGRDSAAARLCGEHPQPGGSRYGAGYPGPVAHIAPAVELGYHVLDLMHANLDAARAGQQVEVSSACERPAPLPVTANTGKFSRRSPMTREINPAF